MEGCPLIYLADEGAILWADKAVSCQRANL